MHPPSSPSNIPKYARYTWQVTYTPNNLHVKGNKETKKEENNDKHR